MLLTWPWAANCHFPRPKLKLPRCQHPIQFPRPSSVFQPLTSYSAPDMSSMGYNYSRRYSPHSVPFLNYDHTDPNECLSLSHASRMNSRGYHMGGPVGGSRMRSNFVHDEPLIDHGPSRRRIAVAVSSFSSRLYAALWGVPQDIRPHYFQSESSMLTFSLLQCGRCRKRKIRCSGDVGDGMGCTNCRSAGLAPNQCLFHRVS